MVPSILPMVAWRVALGCSCIWLLYVALKTAHTASMYHLLDGPPPSPPPSPVSDNSTEVIVCDSCGWECKGGMRGYHIHLGHRPSCMRADTARHRSKQPRLGPQEPATSAANPAAHRDFYKARLKGAVSNSLAGLRVDKLVGGTVVGEVKTMVRDWLTLVGDELAMELAQTASGQRDPKDTAEAIRDALHVFQGLETEAQEMAYLKRPLAEGGVPYLKVEEWYLGERMVRGRKRVRVLWSGSGSTSTSSVGWASAPLTYVACVRLGPLAEGLLLRHTSLAQPCTADAARPTGVGTNPRDPRALGKRAP